MLRGISCYSIEMGTRPGPTNGGGIEPGETPEEGARRELEEETGLKVDSALQLFWQGLLPAFSLPGAYRQWHVYTARTQASQEDIVLGEGLAMVFIAPAAVLELDLTVPSRSILERFLGHEQKG